jgi:hypothetical protein
MSGVLWILAGWFGAALVFALGCCWGGRNLLELQTENAQLRQWLRSARRDPTHDRCRKNEQRLRDHIDRLLDDRDDRDDVLAEAEQILKEQGP